MSTNETGNAAPREEWQYWIWLGKWVRLTLLEGLVLKYHYMKPSTRHALNLKLAYFVLWLGLALALGVLAGSLIALGITGLVGWAVDELKMKVGQSKD